MRCIAGARNVVNPFWCGKVVLLALFLGLWAPQAQAASPERTAVTILGAADGAVLGLGLTLLAFNPYRKHFEMVREGRGFLPGLIVYCLPQVIAVPAGFALGALVSSLFPATAITQIVQAAVLGLGLLGDFVIITLTARPMEDPPEPNMWPERPPHSGLPGAEFRRSGVLLEFSF